MNVGFIGRGHVATAFAHYLNLFNIPIIGFHTRSNPNREILQKCDIIFIATPDDVISSIAEEISSTAKFYCHFSGALSSNVLIPLKKQGITIASLHPAMTFAGNVDLSNISYTFEGSGDGLNDFLAFLNICNINPIMIEPENKPLYHASMCNVSNHITTIIYTTVQMLRKLHICENEIFSLISPLAKTALFNALENSPEKSLTGPIARGDVNTLASHMPFVDETYIALAKKTVELAKNGNYINKETTQNLLEVLNHDYNEN